MEVKEKEYDKKTYKHINYKSSRILNRLQTPTETVRDTIKQKITIVQATCNEMAEELEPAWI